MLDGLNQRIEPLLHDRFGVDHATLEIEHGTCADIQTTHPDPGQSASTARGTDQ